MSKIYNFQFPKYGKLKLLSTWLKGKKTKKHRFLMEVAEDNEFHSKGDIFFLWFYEKGFPIEGSTSVNISENITKENYKKDDHIKNGVYNYYKISIDNQNELIKESINEWLNNTSNLFPKTLSSFMHVEKRKINYIPIIII